MILKYFFNFYDQPLPNFLPISFSISKIYSKSYENLVNYIISKKSETVDDNKSNIWIIKPDWKGCDKEKAVLFSNP